MTVDRNDTRTALASAWQAVIGARYSCKAAARAAREHGLPVTKSEVRDWNNLASSREAARLTVDPLIRAKASRYMRLSSYEAPGAAAARAERAREAREAAINASLKRVARIARGAGWHVRSSKGRDGRISSYYLTPAGGDRRDPVRVSDHEIPATAQREYMSEANGRGSYAGYHGWQIFVTGDLSPTRIRRLLKLAAGGRNPEAPIYD